MITRPTATDVARRRLPKTPTNWNQKRVMTPGSSGHKSLVVCDKTTLKAPVNFKKKTLAFISMIVRIYGYQENEQGHVYLKHDSFESTS